MANQGLQELLVDELQDLFDAEKQLVRALPKLAKTASDEELANALREHLEVTKGQVARLEQVFDSMEMRARSKPCKGMKGLVEEAQEMMEEDHEETVLDAGLIGCARRVEHYEMAAYETARSLAAKLGMKDAAELLQETMREELEADKLLATISKRMLKESGRVQTSQEGRSRTAGRSQSRGAQARSRSQSSSRRLSQRKGRGSAQLLTDREEIRRWAEERGGTPSCVRGTGGAGDIGMLRIDFPGYSGGDSLQPISWDDWFEKFDERNLALIVQEKTGRGQKSNFNRIISRESTGERKPKVRSAR
jgi:ferritin-like metal-binding protein YciE